MRKKKKGHSIELRMHGGLGGASQACLCSGTAQTRSRDTVTWVDKGVPTRLLVRCLLLQYIESHRM